MSSHCLLTRRGAGFQGANFPHFFVYPAGNATVKGNGKRLFGKEIQVPPPGPRINIPAWVFCLGWCADFACPGGAQSHLVFPIIATLLEAAMPVQLMFCGLTVLPRVFPAVRMIN